MERGPFLAIRMIKKKGSGTPRTHMRNMPNKPIILLQEGLQKTNGLYVRDKCGILKYCVGYSAQLLNPSQELRERIG